MEENPFAPILEGRTIIVGIGNTLRGDDGAGPALVDRLDRLERVNDLEHLDYPGRGAGNRSPRLQYVNAGSAPERFLGRVFRERPGTLLLADAVHLGRSPGSFRIMPLDEVDEACTSTHDLSLRVLVAQLQDLARLRGRVYVLGIQPARLDLGEGLSPRVERAVELCARLILEALE
jgi:hydrogenase 3 maturation protease